MSRNIDCSADCRSLRHRRLISGGRFCIGFFCVQRCRGPVPLLEAITIRTLRHAHLHRPGDDKTPISVQKRGKRGEENIKPTKPIVALSSSKYFRLTLVEILHHWFTSLFRLETRPKRMRIRKAAKQGKRDKIKSRERGIGPCPPFSRQTMTAHAIILRASNLILRLGGQSRRRKKLLTPPLISCSCRF